MYPHIKTGTKPNARCYLHLFQYVYKISICFHARCCLINAVNSMQHIFTLTLNLNGAISAREFCMDGGIKHLSWNATSASGTCYLMSVEAICVHAITKVYTHISAPLHFWWRFNSGVLSCSRVLLISIRSTVQYTVPYSR